MRLKTLRKSFSMSSNGNNAIYLSWIDREEMYFLVRKLCKSEFLLFTQLISSITFNDNS